MHTCHHIVYKDHLVLRTGRPEARRLAPGNELREPMGRNGYLLWIVLALLLACCQREHMLAEGRTDLRWGD